LNANGFRANKLSASYAAVQATAQDTTTYALTSAEERLLNRASYSLSEKQIANILALAALV